MLDAFTQRELWTHISYLCGIVSAQPVVRLNLSDYYVFYSSIAIKNSFLLKLNEVRNTMHSSVAHHKSSSQLKVNFEWMGPCANDVMTIHIDNSRDELSISLPFGSHIRNQIEMKISLRLGSVRAPALHISGVTSFKC